MGSSSAPLRFCLGDAEITAVVTLSDVNGAETLSEAHAHQLYECHAVREGSLELFIEDETVAIAPGQLCIIPSMKNHHIQSVSAPVQWLNFLFSVRRIPGKTPAVYDSVLSFLLCREVVVLDDFELLPRYYDDMREAMSPSETNELKLEALFTVVLLTMAEKVKKKSSDVPRESKTDILPYRMEQYISTYYMDDISIGTLADCLHVSQRQIRRYFSRYSQTTFSETLLNQRMWMARYLLDSTDRSLDEIALQVGYKSYSGFFCAFKKFFGKTPSAFLRR